MKPVEETLLNDQYTMNVIGTVQTYAGGAGVSINEQNIVAALDDLGVRIYIPNENGNYEEVILGEVRTFEGGTRAHRGI